MRKLLIYTALFISHSSFCLAQVDSTHNISKNSSGDSTKNKWISYILFSGGISRPWTFSGYGASSYYSNSDGYGYSGYAENGSDFSLTYGLKNQRGWELTGMFSYIRNEFDASGVMNETVANFLGGNGGVYINNVDAIGNYYYNNYSLLAGVTKSWGNQNVNIGITLMIGDFITYTPAMHAIASGETNNPDSVYFNMNSKLQSNFVAELSIHVDVSITAHFFLRLLAEYQLSGLMNGGGYQFIDMTTGNTLYSGTYASSSSFSRVNASLFVGLTDITFGLGYKF